MLLVSHGEPVPRANTSFKVYPQCTLLGFLQWTIRTRSNINGLTFCVAHMKLLLVCLQTVTHGRKSDLSSVSNKIKSVFQPRKFHVEICWTDDVIRIKWKRTSGLIWKNNEGLEWTSTAGQPFREDFCHNNNHNNVYLAYYETNSTLARNMCKHWRWHRKYFPADAV